jgi:tetratricopeptide (TPR) repeat protein
MSSSCTREDTAEMMPVTTDSELALELYETGMVAFDQIKFELAYQNLEIATREDPDFFMAYFWMYFMSGKSPREIADRAFEVEAELNEAEQQIRTAFKYLLDGQEEKVVEHLNKAIDLYPSDPHIHKILYILQFQYLKDAESAIKSILRAVEAQPEYPLAYNQLGYAYLELEQYDKAEKAFDTYIKLSPNTANPYDSKGDYFMKTGQYEEASKSYLRAFEIDPGFRVSEKKAQKAMQLMEKSLIE